MSRRRSHTSESSAVREPFLVAVFCFGLVVSVGCSPDTGGRLGFSGTVTFRGAPLQKGVVEFTSADRTRQSGSGIAKGAFAVPATRGLPPGTYTVRVTAVQEAAAAPAGPPGPESMQQTATDMIPPEYNERSTLTAEIKQGSPNQFSFELK